MIELGCNFSPELISLIKADKVKLDWIKLSKEFQFHSQFKEVNNIKPVLLHFVPGITTSTFPEGWDIESLNKAIDMCKSPHIALHMRAKKSDLDLPLTKKEFLTTIVNLINKKKSEYVKKMLVENMPSTILPDGYKELADPSFIKTVCEKCDIGLCLDVAHARISAFYRDESVEEYINKLPLNRVEEIHISSPRMIQGKFKDVHEALNENDYNLVVDILSKTSPKVVTLEYGGEGSDYIGKSDIFKIEQQLNRLGEIIKNY